MRKISLLLALIMIVTIFAGCGDGGSSKKNNSELIGNTYVADFPIVKEKEKLKVMTITTLNHGDFDEMGFTEYYEELTNIDIEWVICSYEELESKLTLMFQSKDMPDVMCIPSNYMGFDTILNESASGSIIALDDLIDKYGSNIKKAFEKLPEAKTAVTAPDGKIYSLPSVAAQSANHSRFPQKLYMRKTWLDNLGLEVPKTTEDWFNVLKAFKEDDPNGNGKNDEIPMTMYGIEPSFFGSWGISFNYNNNKLCVDDNGKVEYAYSTAAAKKALSYFNRLYSLELCELYDSESKWRTKIKNGLVGCFYNLASYTIAGTDLAEEYVMIAPPQGDANVDPVMSVSGDITPNAFVITSSCKNPSAALRWVDYFYSIDGYYLNTYGKPGDMIEKNEDGKWQFTDYDRSKDRFTFTPGWVIPSFRDDETDKYFADRKESEMTDSEIQDKILNQEVKDVLAGKYEPKNFIWQPFLDKQAADVIDMYYKGIEEYAAITTREFAVGSRNIDTEWDSYIAELNKKGLQLMIAEYQRIYDATNK